MAELRRKGLVTQHTSRAPLAAGNIELGAERLYDKLNFVELTIQGNHRYIIRLFQSDCLKVVDWLARCLVDVHYSDRCSTADALRRLADRLEGGRL